MKVRSPALLVCASFRMYVYLFWHLHRGERAVMGVFMYVAVVFLRDAAAAAASSDSAWPRCPERNRLQGPYGTFGKVDDFKVVGSHSEPKGKREYR